MTASPIETRHRENLELVRRGFDAFAGGDMEAVLAIADPEVEVYMPPTMPNGGTFHGHDGYRLWVERWLEAWGEFRIEVLDAAPIGRSHVITHAKQHGVGRGSGVRVEMEAWYVTEVRGGKFVSLHLYPSYAEALDVAERRERAAE